MSTKAIVSSSQERAQKVPRLESARSVTGSRGRGEDIPAQLIACAFEYLRPEETLLAQRTSKTFLLAFHEWTQMTTVLDLGDHFTMAKMRVFFAANFFPRVTELRKTPLSASDSTVHGTGWNEGDQRFVQDMAKKCPSVTKLTVASDPYWMLPHYLTAFGKNLRVLDGRSLYTTLSRGASECPQLEELRVTGDSICAAEDLEDALMPALMEIEVFFGDPEESEEELWGGISAVATHCQEPTSKLSKVTLTIRGSESSIDGSKIKLLLSCKKLNELIVKVRSDRLGHTREAGQLLEVMQDRRLSFYSITPGPDIQDRDANYVMVPWDKQAVQTALRTSAVR